MWPEQSALTKSISAPPKLFPETPSIAVNVRFLSHPVWFSTLLALFLASKWSSARIGPPFGLCISASSFPMSFWQFRIHWDSSSCVSRLQTFIFDHPIFGVFTSLIESSKNYFLAFNQFPIFFFCPLLKKRLVSLIYPKSPVSKWLVRSLLFKCTTIPPQSFWTFLIQLNFVLTA